MKKIIALSLLGILLNINAHAENKVKCSSSCSMNINGQTVTKKIDCEFPVPPAISFSGAESTKQCT